MQGGQLAVDLLQASLLSIIQLGPGPDEIGPVALQQASLLRIEVESVAALVKRIDPRKQHRIERDRVLMGRQFWCHLGLDGLDGVVGMRAGKIEEDPTDPAEQLA